MSDSEIPCQPRIEEPSKPSPSSNEVSSKAEIGRVMCCQVPSRSQNFRSTIWACVWPAQAIASLAAGVVFCPFARWCLVSISLTFSLLEREKAPGLPRVLRLHCLDAHLRRRVPDSTVEDSSDAALGSGRETARTSRCARGAGVPASLVQPRRLGLRRSVRHDRPGVRGARDREVRGGACLRPRCPD